MTSWTVKHPGGGGALWQFMPPRRRCCCFCTAGAGAVCIRLWWWAVLLLAALLSILSRVGRSKNQILQSHGRGAQQELVEITSFPDDYER
jgi:hypothetical protein